MVENSEKIYINYKPLLDQTFVTNTLNYITNPEHLLLLQQTAEQLIQNSFKHIYTPTTIEIYSKNKNVICPFQPIHQKEIRSEMDVTIHIFHVGHNTVPAYIKYAIITIMKKLINNELPTKELEFFKSNYIYYEKNETSNN